MNFIIEKNIPIPGRSGGKLGETGLKMLAAMAVGDSVFLAGYASYSLSPKYQRQYGIKITTRKVIENGAVGMRVWRIE